MIQTFSERFNKLVEKYKNFSRTYVDISTIQFKEDGNKMIELNYPDNTIYKGKLFNETTVKDSIFPGAMRFCGTEKDPIYLGYDMDSDTFLVVFNKEERNAAVAKIEGDSVTVESGFEFKDPAAEIYSTYPNIIDIIKLQS